MRDELDFAFAVPTERIVNGDGSESLILRGGGTSEAAIDEMVRALSELPGVKGVRRVGKGESRFFGINNWAGCSWEPKGRG